MSVDRRLLSEIEAQLANDILHFEWLSQIVRFQNPECTSEQCVGMVVDAAVQLHRSRAIVVGDAREVDGVVLINPWQDATDELRARIKSTINHSNDDDREFCFWIQLTRHFDSQ